MSSKRIAAVLYACCAALLIGLVISPIRSGAVRLLITICTVVTVFGAPLFLRRKSARMVVLSLLTLVCAALAFLPGHSPSVTQLSSGYLEALRHYEGDRYVWGGENA